MTSSPPPKLVVHLFSHQFQWRDLDLCKLWALLWYNVFHFVLRNIKDSSLAYEVPESRALL